MLPPIKLPLAMPKKLKSEFDMVSLTITSHPSRQYNNVWPMSPSTTCKEPDYLWHWDMHFVLPLVSEALVSSKTMLKPTSRGDTISAALRQSFHVESFLENSFFSK